MKMAPRLLSARAALFFYLLEGKPRSVMSGWLALRSARRRRDWLSRWPNGVAKESRLLVTARRAHRDNRFARLPFCLAS